MRPFAYWRRSVPRLREGQLAGSNHPKTPESEFRIDRPMRLRDLPDEYVSIDPGSVHCGVAKWEVSTESMGAIMQVPPRVVRLVEVYERSPDALYIELRELKRDGIELVLIEDWTLQKGRNQQGTRLETVKTIGVIEYICRRAGVPYRLQSASIKTLIDPWVAAQVPPSHGGGVRVDALASNPHKRDAVRHGLYPALRDPKDRSAVRLVLTEHARGRGKARV